MTSTHWVRWHEDYEAPDSALARRLVVVQQFLTRAFTTTAPQTVLSLCAGDGRDVLPVLAAHAATSPPHAALPVLAADASPSHAAAASPPHAADTVPALAADAGVLPALAADTDARPAPSVERGPRALLVELDPLLSQRARSAAEALDLPGIEVRTADAGDPAVFVDATPVDVLLACGIFGNISPADMRRTVAALPSFLTPGGIVIWTRGRGEDASDDPSQEVRSRFVAEGFEELAFEAPADARFRVGMARSTGPTPKPPQERLFTFS
jgi:hypothetical protein